MANDLLRLQDIIKQKPYLAWYTKDYDQMSEQEILEQVLNYGDWDDVKALIEIKGMEAAAKLFKQSIQGPRDNYKPIFKHFFTKFFKHHAPQCFE